MVDHEKKKRELIKALTQDEVEGPLAALFLIPIFAAAASAAATALLTRLLTPTQRQERGKLAGQEILFQRSEQGLMMPEVYGWDFDGQGGGSKVGAIVIFASGIRKRQSTQNAGGGKKAPKVDVVSYSYDMDVGYLWANRGPYDLKKLWFNTEVMYAALGRTGVVDPTVPSDPDYSPDLPPDPNTPYTPTLDRISWALIGDLITGEKTGVVALGGYHDFAFYVGNTSQLPDPTIEAVIDARFGSGSTPAYRRRAYSTHTRLDLSRWSGLPPNPTAVLEHATLKTWGLTCASWCERVGLASSDYDFTNINATNLRGLRLVDQYQPGEVMGRLAPLFDSYFFEDDKIRAGLLTAESVVTIPETELGWYESEPTENTLDDINSEASPRWEVPRRVVVRFVSPERDYDPGAEGEARQVTGHRREATLDVDLTLTPEEARTAAAKELYRRHVETTRHRFTLSWTYLWLKPGAVVTVTKGAFTFKIRLTQISRGVSALDCEGVDAEPAIFTQSAVITAESPFEPAPVPVQPMSVAGFIDLPAYRTEDEGRSGWYVYVTKRTGEGAHPGAALIRHTRPDDAVNGWDVVANLSTEATAGRARTALGPVFDATVEDSTKVFTADASTNALTATAHEIENDETVMLSNSGGALPGGLSSSTLYHVVGRTANTLQLSLTSGGAAVDITSAGTGTHSVQRVLEIDLYGDKTLQSVSADAIMHDANLSVAGNEYLQFRTAVQVSTSPNRWRISDFTRGKYGTQPIAGTHVANERFVLLDGAVQFVEMDISDLNQTADYKMLTVGQSFDDAATLEVPWTGGTLKYPPVAIQGTKDAAIGDWRFLLFGTQADDERYKLEVVSGRVFDNLRGSASRAVSLSITSALPSDMVPPMDTGKKHYRAATRPGNSVTNQSAYVIQMVSGERTALSFTYSTTLDDSDSPANRESSVTFSPGGIYGLTISLKAQTSTLPASLLISDAYGDDYEDTDGEATNTRFTVEFKDGKVYFFRDRHQNGNPFHVRTLPPEAEFPMECQVQAGTDSTLSAIEIDDEGAAVLYLAAEQVEDFGSTQASLTVRACQQRVVGGVVVDGQVTEVTFP